MRVLVVEDDSIVGLNYAQILQDASVHVLGPVLTIEHALELIEREPIDAALLDIDIAGRSIAPVAKRLVERGVPVIFVTGVDATSVLQDFPTCRVLEKPCTGANPAGVACARTIIAEGEVMKTSRAMKN